MVAGVKAVCLAVVWVALFSAFSEARRYSAGRKSTPNDVGNALKEVIQALDATSARNRLSAASRSIELRVAFDDDVVAKLGPKIRDSLATDLASVHSTKASYVNVSGVTTDAVHYTVVPEAADDTSFEGRLVKSCKSLVLQNGMQLRRTANVTKAAVNVTNCTVANVDVEANMKNASAVPQLEINFAVDDAQMAYLKRHEAEFKAAMRKDIAEKLHVTPQDVIIGHRTRYANHSATFEVHQRGVNEPGHDRVALNNIAKSIQASPSALNEVAHLWAGHNVAHTIQLALPLDFSTMTSKSAASSAFQADVASLLRIRADQVDIISVEQGSVIFKFKLGDSVGKQLLDLEEKFMAVSRYERFAHSTVKAFTGASTVVPLAMGITKLRPTGRSMPIITTSIVTSVDEHDLEFENALPQSAVAELVLPIMVGPSNVTAYRTAVTKDLVSELNVPEERIELQRLSSDTVRFAIFNEPGDFEPAWTTLNEFKMRAKAGLCKFPNVAALQQVPLVRPVAFSAASNSTADEPARVNQSLQFQEELFPGSHLPARALRIELQNAPASEDSVKRAIAHELPDVSHDRVMVNSVEGNRVTVSVQEPKTGDLAAARDAVKTSTAKVSKGKENEKRLQSAIANGAKPALNKDELLKKKQQAQVLAQSARSAANAALAEAKAKRNSAVIKEKEARITIARLQSEIEELLNKSASAVDDQDRIKSGNQREQLEMKQTLKRQEVVNATNAADAAETAAQVAADAATPKEEEAARIAEAVDKQIASWEADKRQSEAQLNNLKSELNQQQSNITVAQQKLSTDSAKFNKLHDIYLKMVGFKLDSAAIKVKQAGKVGKGSGSIHGVVSAAALRQAPVVEEVVEANTTVDSADAANTSTSNKVVKAKKRRQTTVVNVSNGTRDEEEEEEEEEEAEGTPEVADTKDDVKEKKLQLQGLDDKVEDLANLQYGLQDKINAAVEAHQDISSLVARKVKLNADITEAKDEKDLKVAEKKNTEAFSAAQKLKAAATLRALASHDPVLINATKAAKVHSPMLRMSLDSPYSVFTAKKEFVTALESDLKLLGEVRVASEPSSSGTTVSISFKKASEKLRAKQVTTLRAVMKKIMKHSLNFNKLSAELKGTVAVKAVGVTQDPSLVPVKLSPVKAPPPKEVLTSPFLEKLKRLEKEAKDEEDATKDKMQKRKAMEAESKAAVSDQLKEREEEENKVTPPAPKIEVEETDAEVESEKTVKAMAAVVEEKKQVVLTVTSQREATKREVEKMDKSNINTRKAMAEFAVKHDWPSYWDANASLTEDLEKRNAAKVRLLTEDRNVFASRKNFSLAQANETAALESLRVLRQEKKAALASHANELAARQRAQLLKSAQIQTDLMNRLKEELKTVQAAAPRLGMTQNERLVWSRNNENQQTTLTQQINNAEIRAEQLTAQASQNSS